MTDPVLHHVECSAAAGAASAAAPRRMGYWQWGEPTAGHLVLCVHGLTRQGRDFDVLARALLARARDEGVRLRVVCPDIAGRGASDWLADPATYHLGTYVADLAALVSALQAAAPIATFDWVGTSMGGLLGMVVAGMPTADVDGAPAAFPPVHRLVLNDVGPVVEWSALERIGSYVGRGGPFESAAAGAEYLRGVSQGFGPHGDAEWAALSAPMLRPDGAGRLRLHYDPAIAEPLRALTRETAAAGEAALWASYDRITAPTLLIRGGESDLLSPATAASMQTRGPRARLATFAGVGHAPTLVAAEQVEAVLDFLLPRAGANADEAP